MRHTVFLALGSNLGYRDANLAAACDVLSEIVDIGLISPIYETPPWGVLDQPSFLNQVIKGETEYSAVELLNQIKELEIEIGRRPGVRYGPRVIDIDILFYDNVEISLPNLVIPHPRLPGRAFVLVPLADIAPDWRHPKLDRTVAELLRESDITGIQLYDPGIE